MTLTATDESTITANAESVAVAASFSGDAAGAVAIGITVASNTISNAVEASLSNAVAQLKSRAGVLRIDAAETAAITATAVAAAAAFSISSSSAAISAAGVSSTNSITSEIAAFIANSTSSTAPVEAAGAVQITAGDTPTVNATIVAAALSGGDEGAAVGLSLAKNTEGETVSAYIDGSSVKADGGNITVMATTNPAITTASVAAAIADSLGGLTGAGADSNLIIQTATEAYVTDSTLTASGNNVVVQATSTSSATPTVASASAGGVAIAALTSEATIAGTTKAYAGGQTSVSANELDILATGTNTARPKSTVTGVGGITGAGAGSTATITQDTEASIAGGANVMAGNTAVKLIADTPTNFAQGQVDTSSVGGIDIAAVNNSANAGGTTSRAYVAGTLTASSSHGPGDHHSRTAATTPANRPAPA